MGGTSTNGRFISWSQGSPVLRLRMERGPLAVGVRGGGTLLGFEAACASMVLRGDGVCGWSSLSLGFS